MEIEPKPVITRVSDASLLLEPGSRQKWHLHVNEGLFRGATLKRTGCPGLCQCDGTQWTEIPTFSSQELLPLRYSPLSLVSKQSPTPGLTPRVLSLPLGLGSPMTLPLPVKSGASPTPHTTQVQSSKVALGPLDTELDEEPLVLA